MLIRVTWGLVEDEELDQKLKVIRHQGWGPSGKTELAGFLLELDSKRNGIFSSLDMDSDLKIWRANL